MAMSNQTARVLELLKRFNNNQKVCIDSLKYEYLWDGKSEKTIRRDLDIIKKIFPESFEYIKGEKGCYKAITKKSFENFLTPQSITLLAQALNITQQSNIFDSFDISKEDRAILERKIKEKKQLYEFKNRPLELHRANDTLTLLEEAIYMKKVVELNYKDKLHLVKPYKILFINENFYLASEVIDREHIYSSFRVSWIEDVKVSSKTFHKNPDLENFIADIQTPFALYQPDYKRFLIEVILKVDSKKAHYFKQKKFLKSQQIIKTHEDGSLILSYKVTQEIEIKDLIKQWMPHLTIIKPPTLKESLKRDVEEFILTL